MDKEDNERVFNFSDSAGDKNKVPSIFENRDETNSQDQDQSENTESEVQEVDMELALVVDKKERDDMFKDNVK